MLTIIVVLSGVFLWHWMQISRMRDLTANSHLSDAHATSRLSINPVTDVAVIIVTRCAMKQTAPIRCFPHLRLMEA